MKLTDDYMLSTYQVEHIISKNQHSEVALVRCSINDELYVRKIYDADKRTIFYELMQIDSPYLPKIHQLIFTDCTIIIEEYLHGKSLQEYLQEQKPISKEQFRRIFDQLLLALDVLHHHHIIHRDIKPANIIVMENQTIKLIDFSISRMYNPLAACDTELFGTFEYAPPEQFGFSQTDFRSDIYSLGKTLEKLAILCRGSHGLENLIKRCRSFDPDDRFQTVEQVQQAMYLEKKKYKRKLILVAMFIIMSIVVVSFFLYHKEKIAVEKGVGTGSSLLTKENTEQAGGNSVQESAQDTTPANNSLDKKDTPLVDGDLIYQPNAKKNNTMQDNHLIEPTENNNMLTYANLADRIINTRSAKTANPCIMLSGNQTKLATISLADGMEPITILIYKVENTLNINLDDHHGKRVDFVLQKKVNVPEDVVNAVFDGEVLFYDLNQDGIIDIFPSISKRQRVVYPKGSEQAGSAYYNTNYTVGWGITYDRNNGFILSDCVMVDGRLSLVNAYTIMGDESKNTYGLKDNRLVQF